MNLQPKVDPFLQKKKVKQQILVSNNPEEIFKTLEDLFLDNAEAAAKAFKSNMHLLNAEQLAKCSAIFAGKGLEIKMAREKGFKDQPINANILIQLSETLKQVTPARIIDIP